MYIYIVDGNIKREKHCDHTQYIEKWEHCTMHCEHKCNTVAILFDQFKLLIFKRNKKVKVNLMDE